MASEGGPRADVALVDEDATADESLEAQFGAAVSATVGIVDGLDVEGQESGSTENDQNGQDR